MLTGKRPSKDFKKSLKSCSLNFEILRSDPELNSEQNCVKRKLKLVLIILWPYFETYFRSVENFSRKIYLQPQNFKIVFSKGQCILVLLTNFDGCHGSAKALTLHKFDFFPVLRYSLIQKCDAKATQVFKIQKENY